jgi:hypothetical protein
MHERKKLAEAEHFLTRMESTRNTPATFRQELSAFLTAARSVLQYAERESRRRTGGQAWYDNAVSGHTLIAFFKEKRDTNIHAEPVVPSNDATVRIQAGLTLSGTLGMVHTNPQGEVLERRQPDQPTDFVPKAKRAVEVEYIYYFPQARHVGDVLSACRDYLAELRALATDGLAKAMISG